MRPPHPGAPGICAAYYEFVRESIMRGDYPHGSPLGEIGVGTAFWRQRGPSERSQFNWNAMAPIAVLRD